MRRLLTIITVTAIATTTARGQAPAGTPYDTTKARVAATPADVASLDAIVTTLYDVISGPAGKPRDWDRFRSLFAPKARLMPTGRRPNGEAVLREWSPEEYLAIAGANLERTGFFERELARRTDRYGDVVQLFSTYESRRTADLAEKPFSRGINSIQCWFDGTRWWIVSIFWQSERPDLPIPAPYLRSASE
ncbi:MAG: hypothetical protein MUF21_12880 [Gemmatimonadaceae bacterium]|nr:hypothetical protein [Gemmatimonadaceae bacterium]